MSVRLRVTADSAVVRFCFRRLIFSSLPLSVSFRLLVPSSKFSALLVIVSDLSSSLTLAFVSSGSSGSCEISSSLPIITLTVSFNVPLFEHVLSLVAI